MRRSCRSGLTLMEVLVVVSLITILAAFLLPVSAQVRARAHQATCLSNLAQIARAGMLYVQDYDERFPSCYPRQTPPFYVDPRTTLQPYVKSWDIFYCPDRHTVRRECLDPMNSFRPNARCMGYGYNWGSSLAWDGYYTKGDGLIRYPADGRQVLIGVALTEVADPSHCLFYGDTNDYKYLTLLRGTMPGVHCAGDPNERTNDFGDPYEPPRHHEGNSFAFVDGHVEWLRFPGGRWIDGGPWVVPDMSMYSRTGRWEPGPVP